MNKKSIVRISAAQAKTRKGQTDWAALKAIKNSDINTSDLPELNKEFWKLLRVVKANA